MFLKSHLLALLIVQICDSQSDGKKWVWGTEGRRRLDDRFYTGLVSNDNRKYTSDSIGSSRPLFQPSQYYGANGASSNEKLRYEITEPPYVDRPESPINRPNGGYRPDYNRPSSFRPDGSNSYRPTRPIDNGYRPPSTNYIPGGYRPTQGPGGRPILTGPVPSWEQSNGNRYRDYNKCKCVHAFNCNTPGIKFGSCDVDKQYCCYKGRDIEDDNRRPENKPVYERPRPVLAGPGGPVDGYKRPNQVSNTYQRPFRPFSDINRYMDNERELEEAYRRGLESAIYELRDRPGNLYQNVNGYRDYYPSEYPKPNKQNTKYGLYDPAGTYFSRSASSNITAISDS